VRQVLVAVDVGDPRDAVNARSQWLQVNVGISSAICVAPAPWSDSGGIGGNRASPRRSCVATFTSAATRRPGRAIDCTPGLCPLPPQSVLRVQETPIIVAWSARRNASASSSHVNLKFAA